MNELCILQVSWHPEYSQYGRVDPLLGASKRALLCLKCPLCLQDDVPSFDDAQAFAIMEEELGRPLAAVFSSISEHPIAAASLGQVRAAGVLRFQEPCSYALRQALGNRPGKELSSLHILRGL